MKLVGSLLFSLFFVVGCATVPVPPPAPGVAVPSATPIANFPSLVRVSSASSPSLTDDADLSDLRRSAEASASYFSGLSSDQRFSLAGDTYTARDMAESMESFVQLLDQKLPPAVFAQRLKDDYNLYQSAGSDGQGLVTFSSYYEPTISARLQPDKKYRYPIYGRPDDLIDVDLGLFNSAYQGARISGRRQGRALVPYYTREDIDSNGVLTQRGLEIAWAKDPLDIFFLQVEGSGWLDLGKGRMVRIRYEGDNGRKFKSVGLYLISSGRVPARGFGHKQLVRYMKKHPEIRQEILNVDERYIFFRIDTSTTSAYAFGNISEPLTPGRSIATDPKVFPRGMLAWISVEASPNRSAGASGQAVKSSKRRRSDVPMQRFVLNQDEGGAIQGPGRVDFFMGHGKKAEHFATHFWNPGQLYFLVKRKS